MAAPPIQIPMGMLQAPIVLGAPSNPWVSSLFACTGDMNICTPACTAADATLVSIH
jgi:hypothetical protein